MVSLWWFGGGIVVLVCTIFGCENFPRFRDLFLGGLRWHLHPVDSCGMRKTIANAEGREGTANAEGAMESAPR